MAASSQSSPNQPVQTHTKTTATAVDQNAPTAKDPPTDKSEKTTIKEASEQATGIMPTYETTENSDEYKKAKQLLTEGKFDECLNTVEEALTTTLSLLPESEEKSLHESLAPLHYLYGTTLLYSVEESDENPETNLVVDSSGANGAPEESVGDLEIAWENLESARHIVELLITTKPSDKLKLDLAQIHLRLGDLQRTDGRYEGAISDYQACLELREPILGVYNRGVADSRYMLALVYMMIASEGDRQQEKAKEGQPDAAEAAGTNAAGPTLSPEKIEEYRSKSIVQYISSAKSIAGTIALASDADPDAITADAPSSGEKTTGLDPLTISYHSSSRNLRAIRDRVSQLELKDENMADMLDEIQEIVDEAENTKRGLHDVSKMTAKVHAEIAAADKDKTSDQTEAAEGGTTTVGFRAAGTTAAASATAAPIMVVKKKKKRDDADSKLPAQDSAKRSKTE